MDETEDTRFLALPYLEAWRVVKVISRIRLAEKSGVGEATIARLERGETKARYQTIEKLAEALEITPQELVHVNPKK